MWQACCHHVQEADSEALKNIEDTARDVTERVKQLAADREDLAQSRAQTSNGLSAAKESLTAKKAALDQAMDSNRRNGWEDRLETPAQSGKPRFVTNLMTLW